MTDGLPSIGDIVTYSGQSESSTQWKDGTWNDRRGRRYIVADTAYDYPYLSVLVKSVGDNAPTGGWVEEDFFICSPESLTILSRATYTEEPT